MTKTEHLSHCIQFTVSCNKHLVENERDLIMPSAHQTKHCSISIKHCYSALKNTTNKQKTTHPPKKNPKNKPPTKPATTGYQRKKGSFVNSKIFFGKQNGSSVSSSTSPLLPSHLFMDCYLVDKTRTQHLFLIQ